MLWLLSPNPPHDPDLADHIGEKAYEIAQRVRQNEVGAFSAGKCKKASKRLCEEYQKAGIDCEYWYGYFWGHEHAVVILDGVVVDITADQFGEFPEVFLTWYNEDDEDAPYEPLEGRTRYEAA